MKRPAPLSHAGRQTLVYLCLAGSGPVLTGVVGWSLYVIRFWNDVEPIRRLDAFARLATLIATALLIIVIALACFVSIRAIRIGKDGIEAESHDDDDGNTTTTLTATATVTTPPGSTIDAGTPNS